ncbi:hypothetical protein COV18_04435 [Candidatus Woesearchaeota archaeon CG10_big_fil_rev_8_21_14_0_10_37_12]|nr:MAG: hypothetical protein COV18_04435 [Candidatus Woesearchaeota archaeon CG10_big_fil_rev_8_21_14_0_10_37_12]
MSFKQFIRPRLAKGYWFIGIILFSYFSDKLLDISELLAYFVDTGSITTETIAKLDVWFFIANIIVGIITYYVISCLIIYIYEKLSEHHPRIEQFFELSKEKYLWIATFFVLFLIFALISAMFSGITFGNIFNILLMILGLDKITIVHELYQGNFSNITTMPSLILSIFWWYLLSSIIVYIRNK